MSTKKTIKDILKVTFSNFVKLFSSVLVGFLLPKIMGVTDYGYYKTFTLYATYVGLFHFGFADGIYLKFGGTNYEDLNKESFRLYTSFLFFLEAAFSFVLGIVFFFLLDGELKIIFVCLACYLICNNLINYYQIISQITNRFGELSIRNIIQSILTCLAILSLWAISRINGELIPYRVYVFIYCAIVFLLAVWYVVTYRDLTFGFRKPLKENKKELFSFFSLGFPLLVANLCSSLIFTIDRQFVNILFDKDVYAIYAFAYNMMTLITTALAAVSTVLYPTLKRTNKKVLKSNYSLLVQIILIVVFLGLIVYFPLLKFVDWFLPKYVDSLPIFRIILPGVAVSSSISIVMHNYYKTEEKEFLFFIKSIVVLAISIGANFLAYWMFKTTIAISIASIIVMLIWYILVEEYFIRKYKIKWIKNFTYLILMSSAFYSITIISTWWLSMIIYVFSLVVITYLFFYKDINNLIKKITSKNKPKKESLALPTDSNQTQEETNN